MLAGCSYPEKITGEDEKGNGKDESSSLVSIEFLKSHYRGYPYTFTENYRIGGCVVSTDRSGNYYKALSMADDTGAIELKLDCERLYERYMLGCQVEVECNGLTIGSYGGVLQLGSAPMENYETGYIAEDDIAAVIHIRGMSEVGVVPVPLRIAALKTSDVGRLAAFDNVQFREGGTAVAWCDEDAGDPSGFCNTDRELVDTEGNTLKVRTSRRADFASWTLPAGSGTAEGIISIYNGEFQLIVTRPDLLYSSMTAGRF